MRLVLLFGQFLWSEQTLLSTKKLSPQQHCQHVVNISTGHGEDFLRLLWQEGTCQAKSWARLGIALYPGQDKTDMSPQVDPYTHMNVPGVATEDIPGRLASFMWNLCEERFWSYAETQHRWPGAFAGILHETDHGSVLEQASEFWEACLFAETRQNAYPGFHSLRAEVYWMNWPVCQLPFRLLSQCHFRRHPEVMQYFLREFNRLGDSKVTEETHKIIRRVEEKEQDGKEAATKRIYHTLVGHDDLLGKQATGHGAVDSTLKRSPLEWRGVDIACVPSHTYYEVNPKMTRPPPGGWPRAFDAKGTTLPRSWGADNVLESRKTYVSKRPEDARHSIAAAKALLALHRAGAWNEAGNTWQCCAILPHTFIRKKENQNQPQVGASDSKMTGHGIPAHVQICFVIARATYAARVCAAELVADELAMIDLREEWYWLLVTDIRQWECIPVTWVVSIANPSKFGFLAGKMGIPIPAVVAALVAIGRRRVLQDKAKKLIKHCMDEEVDSHSTHAEQVRALINKLMVGHPDLEKWLDKWQKCENWLAKRAARTKKKVNPEIAHDISSSSSEDNELDDDMAWREGLALEEIPDAQEFKGRREIHHKKSHRATQKNMLEKAQSGLMNPPGTGSPTQPTNTGSELPAPAEAGQQVQLTDHGSEHPPPSMPEDPRSDRRVQTQIPWAKKFTPGHYESRTQVPDVVQCVRLHYDRGPKQWFAKYELPDGEVRQRLPTAYKQQSKSKKGQVDEQGQIEHQAFQFVLQWVWDKHARVAPGSAPPMLVSEALRECTYCRQDLPCEAMSKLKASGPDHQPQGPRMPTPQGGSMFSATQEIMSLQTLEATPAATKPAGVLEVTGHGTSEAKPPPVEARPSSSSSAPPHVHEPLMPEVLQKCDLCQHFTTHTPAQCPLALAPWPRANAPQGFSRPPWCRSDQELPRVEIPGAKLVRVPGDGNCMFTAYHIAVSNSLRQPDTDHSFEGTGTAHGPDMARQGRECRTTFLKRVEKHLSSLVDKKFGDLFLYSILLDVSDINAEERRRPSIKWPEAQAYLRHMSSWGTRASWGGVAELFVFAHMSLRKIYLAEHHNDGTWQLFLPPLGPECDAKGSICVAWAGGHYDAVRLPENGWKNCIQDVCV